MLNQMVLTTSVAISPKQFKELQQWWPKIHHMIPGAESRNLSIPLDNRYIDFELRQLAIQ